jgi:hypothetical protein
MREFFRAGFITLILCGMAYANDASDLQKLQLLTKQELYLYEKVKSDAPELHKFIVTRAYLRTVKPLIEGTDPTKIDGCKLPKMSKDISINYVVDDREWDILWHIMLDQEAGCKDKTTSAARSGSAYANDASDLQKLQPLTKEELNFYEKVKNDAPELHNFIVTRTYLRAIKPMVEGTDETKLDGCKLPKLPKDISMLYADNKEGVMLFSILLDQTSARCK